jgi:hypothetical protein
MNKSVEKLEKQVNKRFDLWKDFLYENNPYVEFTVDKFGEEVIPHFKTAFGRGIAWILQLCSDDLKHTSEQIVVESTIEDQYESRMKKFNSWINSLDTPSGINSSNKEFHKAAFMFFEEGCRFGAKFGSELLNDLFEQTKGLAGQLGIG